MWELWWTKTSQKSIVGYQHRHIFQPYNTQSVFYWGILKLNHLTWLQFTSCERSRERSEVERRLQGNFYIFLFVRQCGCTWHSRNIGVSVNGDISEQVEDLLNFLRQAWAALNQSNWLFQACPDTVLSNVICHWYIANLLYSHNFNENWELPDSQ